jgi:hypothetical protein
MREKERERELLERVHYLFSLGLGVGLEEGSKFGHREWCARSTPTFCLGGCWLDERFQPIHPLVGVAKGTKSNRSSSRIS